MSIMYGEPRLGKASTGGTTSCFLIDSKASRASWVGSCQFGLAFFLIMLFTALAIQEKFSINLRYTFAAPKKDRIYVVLRGNVQSANAFVLSSATASLPGVMT